MSDTTARCELCGEPMPVGEEMFKYHGYSGECPKPPLAKSTRKTVRDFARILRHPPASDAEADKLIRFFNTPEGYSHFGYYGDTESRSPAETAIKAMRELIAWKSAKPEALVRAEREACAQVAHNNGIYSERYADGDVPNDVRLHNKACWEIRDAIRASKGEGE